MTGPLWSGDVAFPDLSYPAVFQASDAASLKGQQAYRRLVRSELALLLLGAALGTAAAFAPGLSSVVPAFAALAFLAAAMMKIVNRELRYDQEWFDGRAVAETAKSATWRYMMRVPPFAKDQSADDTFADQLMAIVAARPRLHAALADESIAPRQITDDMRAVRAMPVVERRERYRRGRLNDQAHWYQAKSRYHHVQAMRWFWLSLLMEILGVAIAVASLAIPSIGQWNLVSLLAAIATTATAWSQLNRHEELSKAYGLAYQELLLIDGRTERAVTEESLSKAVEMAESAVSREHTMWMARVSHGEDFRGLPTVIA